MPCAGCCGCLGVVAMQVDSDGDTVQSVAAIDNGMAA
jgi:hypothetical protein